MLPQYSDFRHPVRRFSQFFGAAALEPEQRMLRWTGFFPDSLDELLREDRFSATCSEALMESYRVAWERPDTDSSLARTLALNFETYLPEDLLLKADRCSMAHGLELRSPFLDTSVMEFAAGLPDRMRIRGVRQRGLKWILRSAFSDLLPEPIARRPKMGFAIPLPLWFRTSWKERFEDLVLSDGVRLGAWLNVGPIRRIWAEHQRGHDHGHKLWALLTLETWLRSR
ncbi:MAG: hypothetical protein IIC54_09650 [Proteobacteria bacterium]|nr:hypothetical protein [Pseudomonadota bacterium]